jgi:hypothetical protein
VKSPCKTCGAFVIQASNYLGRPVALEPDAKCFTLKDSSEKLVAISAEPETYAEHLCRGAQKVAQGSLL